MKNRINKKRSRIMIPLCSGCPIPISPRRKLSTKIPMAIVHAFRFRFHNCRDNTKRTMEKARWTMRPISKDPCMAFEILENGKKVKRNRKKEKTASSRIVIFSIRIRVCRFFSRVFCDSFISYSSRVRHSCEAAVETERKAA